MKVSFTFLFILSLTNLVKCGYLTGHHPLPSNLITSRTTIGGAVGGGPSSGAYSSSQLVQTVSTSPNQFQSSFSTHHPSQYGYYNRANQVSGINQIQFTPNQVPGQNQGNNQNYGYSQNQGQNYNGYNSNIPSVIAYGSYGYNGNLGNPGQGGPGQLQGGQPQILGESNQNHGRYYQTQHYAENNAQGQSGYGRF